MARRRATGKTDHIDISVARQLRADVAVAHVGVGVSAGVGVDVAASVDTPWRRDFGDPLYIRPLVDGTGREAGRRGGPAPPF